MGEFELDNLARVKAESKKERIENLPNIIIQDSIKNCAYILPSNTMDTYKVTVDTWSKIGSDTVTFVIPGEDYIEEIPPFSQVNTDRPSVLIQFPSNDTAFFLSFDDLEKYETNIPENQPEQSISFILPRGTELIEELPDLRISLLQTQEKDSKLT